MDRYFERISEIIEKRKVSSRIKFMLQDVQDLRKVNNNAEDSCNVTYVCVAVRVDTKKTGGFENN